jgi:Zn-finger nucleic acid-binding protein
MSTCTCCHQGQLLPHTLDNGLFVYACNACQGYAIDIHTYLDWRREQPPAAPAGPDAPAHTPPHADHRHALHCPACHRLMLKYRVHAGESPSIDTCLRCDCIWLDGGEWAYLESIGLHTHLTAISTPAWQARRAQLTVNLRRAQLDREQLVDEVYAQAQQVQAWLQDQPQRKHILKMLNRTT